MKRAQIGIFTLIIVIFAVIFYITQAGYLGINKTPTSQETISKIPAEITLTQQQQQSQQTNPAQAQQMIDTASLDQYKTSSATAVIGTSKGDITVVLYGDASPLTVANFIMKAKTNFYNNLIFHRVEDWVIQGGDPKGNGTGGGNMPVEFNDKSFTTGALGVASRGDGKVQNDSQFFIVKKDATYLDGQYTNFGQVTEGMDVVEKITIGDKITGVEIK